MAVFAKKAQVIEPGYAWTLLQPLGLHEPSTIDTLFTNYAQRFVPSMQSDAWACTGNYGAEGTNRIWRNHQPISEFFFKDGMSAWLPSADKQKFYNTRVPMTLLSYNTGGGRETAQDRLHGVFSGNINRRAQVGAMLDYIYSKGSYNYQADKDLMWGVNGSYMGDRFEFQGFYNHYNMLNKENGGITDNLYITDPAKLQGGVSSINSKSIPTNLTAAHTRLVGGELLLNSRYKVGYWQSEMINDTTERRTYIPSVSFIWTLRYNQARHGFRNSAPGEATKFFDNTYLSATGTNEKTRYYSLSNTIGISMLEGFRPWAKFGLSAYITHQLRSYTQATDTLARVDGLTPLPDFYDLIADRERQNLAWVGAQLTKQKGDVLRYEATGELGILGPAAGDVRVDGSVTARMRMLGDTVSIRAFGRFNNEHAPYLLENYRSNHFIWHNDFGKIRTLRLGGQLNIPHTGTAINAFVENVQNHIYFNSAGMPEQHGDNVQVISASIDQQLHWRALHWDNRVTWQKSSDNNVIALPSIAIYSNLYAQFRIATLRVQFGIDCDYYTKYFAPSYQPATAAFVNQTETKIGNYPFMNLYANFKLSKARFYVMMSHINQGMTGKNYFSMPHYPLNPRRFQLGVSVDFAN